MSSLPDGLDHCFKQGTDARQDGRKLADNPYDIETDEHTEWAAGWRATFDLDEDEDAASMRIRPGSTDRSDGLDEDDGFGPRK